MPCNAVCFTLTSKHGHCQSQAGRAACDACVQKGKLLSTGGHFWDFGQYFWSQCGSSSLSIHPISGFRPDVDRLASFMETEANQNCPSLEMGVQAGTLLRKFDIADVSSAGERNLSKTGHRVRRRTPVQTLVEKELR
jgi:hypothetical protein